MERVSTGISELDKILLGYPKGRSVLITGGAGVGKTIMGLHFIAKCCEKSERSTYIATEETKEDLLAQALGFGWDLIRYEKLGLLEIKRVWEKRMIEAEYAPSSGGNSTNFIEILQEIPLNVKNVVIDNIGVFAIGMSIHQFREQMDLLVYKLNQRGCTTLIMCDDAVGEQYKDVAMYSSYGAIWLFRRENPFTNRRERLMEIRKMRNTMVPTDYLRFEITDKGIVMLGARAEK